MGQPHIIYAMACEMMTLSSKGHTSGFRVIRVCEDHDPILISSQAIQILNGETEIHSWTWVAMTLVISRTSNGMHQIKNS